MKNFTIGTMLAVTTSLAAMGITQANAVDNTVTNMSSEQAVQTVKKNKADRMLQRGPLSKLNLTDAQKTQIKAIMQQRFNNRPSKEIHEQEKAKIQALIANNTLDNTQLNALASAHAEKAKERFIQRIQTKHAIAQVLTPEQRVKMQEMQEAHKGKGRGHKHHGSNSHGDVLPQ